MAPIRTAFERSGLSLSEVARRMGWMRTVPDRWRIRRALGYAPDNPHTPPREWMNYDLALHLCDAIGADYHDVGV